MTTTKEEVKMTAAREWWALHVRSCWASGVDGRSMTKRYTAEMMICDVNTNDVDDILER